jgi:hypothetical protein
MLFDFALVSKHIQTPADPSPSYADYGFGSDKRAFAGSHRFVINRKERDVVDEKAEKEEEYVQLSVECFRCNPMINRDSWAESMPWLHYWYGRFLWAEAVRAVLRR